ncbi:hydrogenase small subunit [Lawsonia intracellularis]|uniref:cytochrome-c3 hydrogenase n=1 Tax=Lawsonia intracellularis (strain PHE/MN1-00) TaxID=363253 RepID=Q1MR83_LAWIP|nr:hydrogenase small subunit [Lawsonia intracellularis]AGC49853.1 hydrogenase-1 small subunit [Lawsonia intracellularis N343]KAA0205357.1 hydrogenase [Lawsonia intracellularis]MBZ3892109.1 hydrogenase small subunit [Lawsonia intracellularis]OMQ04620.1 hydrogenase [Lawsonia intracellularis]RBN32096.1 hydrogenase [Lawsonia intracellularis]
MNYPPETQYEALEKRGVSRRDFLKFCSFAAVYLGLGPTGHLDIANAMENKPRLPVVWINGLSCSCCTESFIRSAHPLASDIVLSMISLDYQDTIMAAAGHQAAEVFEETITEYKGRYILAVEGNAPLADQGMACFQEGRPFLETLKRGAEGASAVICWGTCASWGCVQAAHPNPTRATPVPKLIHDKPIIRIPGCPPIPEVMSNVVAYILTYERLPELDSQKRPAMFYGKTVHDQCVRRAHFDAGQFVESWDDPAASLGYCLYKMGCKGPTTYNACPVTRWNDGVSYPIESGHGCIGCSENDFWDRGSFYDRITTIPQFGTNTTANTVGLAAVGAVGAAAATHAAISTAVHLKRKANAKVEEENAQPHTCCHSHQSTDNTTAHTCCSNSADEKTQNTTACCHSKNVMNSGNSNETTDS